MKASEWNVKSENEREEEKGEIERSAVGQLLSNLSFSYSLLGRGWLINLRTSHDSGIYELGLAAVRAWDNNSFVFQFQNITISI